MAKTITRHIDRLLLDPNNYRFIDNKDYVQVPDDLIADKRIQERTYSFIVGKNEENISDLIISFKSNGILKLDPIQVTERGGNYLVVEGNRRTATLKHLYDQWKSGKDTGKLTEKDFKSVELVLIDEENPIQHLITMGLHHINGKKKWSPVNQSQLIKDLRFRYGLTEEEICNSLAITKHNLKRNLRVLSLIDRYKASDYGDQFETNMYSIFEEIIKNVKIKNWLQWDDSNLEPASKLNEERIFSWISKEEFIERNDENEDENVIIKDPIITKSHEIRELSKFIDDSKAINRMEDSRSISEGFALSDVVGEARLKNALDNISKEINYAFQFSEYMSDDEFERVQKIVNKFNKLLPSEDSNVSIASKSSAYYFTQIKSQFSTVSIQNYRKLKNIEIKNLKRVNIFAGLNNNGKTSILEAVYLVTRLNNLQSLIDLEKFRGRFINDFPTKWFDKLFVTNINIGASFNEKELQFSISKHESRDNFDKSHYLNSIITDVTIGSDNFDSTIHLFDNKDLEFYYQRLSFLCPAAFTSPYRYNGELLRKAHAHSIKDKYFSTIIQFIREYFDSSIEKIEMVEINEISRFLVTTNSVDHAVDLTKYGEGLQRIFEIALLLCYCKDGVLFIDELDSAVHKTLLIPFTAFIQDMAQKYNVQVFLTTHSKECIDAFVKNDFPDDDLIAYSLQEENSKIICKFLEGNKLAQLVESVDIDIR